jgi:hypothetical protein
VWLDARLGNDFPPFVDFGSNELAEGLWARRLRIEPGRLQFFLQIRLRQRFLCCLVQAINDGFGRAGRGDRPLWLSVGRAGRIR